MATRKDIGPGYSGNLKDIYKPTGPTKIPGAGETKTITPPPSGPPGGPPPPEALARLAAFNRPKPTIGPRPRTLPKKF